MNNISPGFTGLKEVVYPTNIKPLATTAEQDSIFLKGVLDDLRDPDSTVSFDQKGGFTIKSGDGKTEKYIHPDSDVFICETEVDTGKAGIHKSKQIIDPEDVDNDMIPLKLPISAIFSVIMAKIPACGSFWTN